MKTEERKKRIKKALKDEEFNDEELWWMSFCDITRPKGKRNIGVIITKAKGMAHAIAKAHKLGINPGGEVQACQIPNELVKNKDVCDKLLSGDDLRKYDLVD